MFRHAFLYNKRNKNKNKNKFQKDIATLCILFSLRSIPLELCIICHVMLLLLLGIST